MDGTALPVFYQIHAIYPYRSGSFSVRRPRGSFCRQTLRINPETLFRSATPRRICCIQGALCAPCFRTSRIDSTVLILRHFRLGHTVGGPVDVARVSSETLTSTWTGNCRQTRAGEHKQSLLQQIVEVVVSQQYLLFQERPSGYGARLWAQPATCTIPNSTPWTAYQSAET